MKDIPTSKRVLDMRKVARQKKIRLSVFIVILFLSIFAALAYFSFHPKVNINKVVVTGVRILDKKEINKSVLETIKGKYFYTFSRSNFLIYPHKDVYNKLLSDFPRIEKLVITKHNLTTLNIDIVERTGIYLYCGQKLPDISSDIGNNCFYINSDGFIFDKAPYFSGNIYFKFYNTLDTDTVLGSQVMDKESFKKITTFLDGLIDLSFKPNYMIINSNGQYEIYLDHKPLGTNPKIMLKKDNDLVVLLDNLASSMRKDEFKNEINSKYDSLEYIDLRFRNKVLYKISSNNNVE